MTARHYIVLLMPVLACVPGRSKAQDVSEEGPLKTTVAISLGVAVPMNDLANKTFRTRSSGFAQPGPAGAISVTHRLRHDWGLTAAVRVQRHGVDEAAWARENPAGPPGMTWSMDSGPWEMATVLFGAHGLIPKGPRPSFELRFMAGAFFARSPEVDVTGTFDGDGIRMLRPSATTTGFAFSFGAGYRHDLGSRLAATIDADLWGGQARFRHVQATVIEIVDDVEAGQFAYVDDLKQRMNALLITAGLALRF